MIGKHSVGMTELSLTHQLPNLDPESKYLVFHKETVPYGLIFE